MEQAEVARLSQASITWGQMLVEVGFREVAIKTSANTRSSFKALNQYFFQSWPKNLFSTQVYLEIAFKCHQKCFWVRAPPTWVSPRLSWRCNGLKSIQIWARKLLFKTHPEQNKTIFKCIEMRVRADKTNIALWFSPVQVVRSFEQVSGVKHKKWLQHDDSLRFHLRWYTFGLSTDAMIRIWHKFCNIIKLNSKWGKV